MSFIWYVCIWSGKRCVTASYQGSNVFSYNFVFTRSSDHWFIISSDGQRPLIRLHLSSILRRCLLLPRLKMSFCVYSGSLSIDDHMSHVTFHSEISTGFLYCWSNPFMYLQLLRIAWYPSPSSDYHFQSEYPKYLLISCCVQLVILGTIRPYLTPVSEIQQFYCLLFSRNGISAQFQEIVLECFSCRRYRCV